MGKSWRLRLGDVRAAFLLVGECRDLGHDLGLWGRHLFEKLVRIRHAKNRLVPQYLEPASTCRLSIPGLMT